MEKHRWRISLSDALLARLNSHCTLLVPESAQEEWEPYRGVWLGNGAEKDHCRSEQGCAGTEGNAMGLGILLTVMPCREDRGRTWSVAPGSPPATTCA